MFANIYLYLPLIFSNGVKRHVVEYDKLRFQPEIICNAVCEECLQICQMVTRHVLSMINSDFSQKYFNACEECLQISLIFSIGEKRHVVEYDKLRFQPEIICNDVCEECL